jgi:hypothetical protein
MDSVMVFIANGLDAPIDDGVYLMLKSTTCASAGRASSPATSANAHVKAGSI